MNTQDKQDRIIRALARIGYCVVVVPGRGLLIVPEVLENIA